jgi:hypothetical protein
LRGVDVRDDLFINCSMKLFLLVAITGAALALLVSCGGLPPSTSPTDALVIGSFILDFPTGFFDKSRMSIRSGVQLNFLDLTSGAYFSVFTRRGHFWFIAKGGDDYELVSYEYITTIGANDYHLGARSIGVGFHTRPGDVIYPGDFRFTFTMPPNSTQIAQPAGELDYELEDKMLSAMRIDYVFRDSSAPLQWNDKALVDFMQGLASESLWLGQEVVDVGN